MHILSHSRILAFSHIALRPYCHLPPMHIYIHFFLPLLLLFLVPLMYHHHHQYSLASFRGSTTQKCLQRTLYVRTCPDGPAAFHSPSTSTLLSVVLLSAQRSSPLESPLWCIL
ncbi:hypothetical protein L226DRAFT_301845 [Lentinus tigrinus ALCF2SS1-7]|uniref:uncharacterized protein n=1 Tax=Lentinus tigrinus ALCF2SS1-7 TaxID=1328758 RepID=UPI0011663446|nr:hypothetical protein L226DRAFT_301845 [Lentinus tigrinus ALCF2SS1-7]